jgi:hypothetical protein
MKISVGFGNSNDFKPIGLGLRVYAGIAFLNWSLLNYFEPRPSGFHKSPMQVFHHT